MKSKVSRSWAGIIIFTTSAIFIGQSLADDVIPAPVTEIVTETPSPEPVPSSEPSTPIETSTPTPEPTPSTQAGADTSETPTAEPTPSPSPTPTKEPPHAIANQSMFIRSTSSLRADPRARSIFITPIEIYSPSILLACVSSGNLIVDVGTKFAADGIDSDYISGDFSNHLMITGPSSLVMTILNSFNGMRAASYSSGVVGKYIFLRFVAVSEPVLDPKLCNDGNPSNNRIISINPIGIDLDMKKADVRLSKN